MAKAGGRETAAAEEVVLWREEARRFETPDGEAYLQYRLLAAAQPRSSSSSGDGGATTPAAVMEMAHTYVPGSKRGRGLAARLCDAAFAHARRRGMRILPTCSYISETYLPRNPEWNELVITEKEPKPSSM
ncbi:acetyltransferase At1g77540-like [Oryza glaberrima]|nr:acetyltransferase At1g77540-like [Oryza glaberrima]